MIFVNRRAVMLAIEIIFAVFDAVWPRGQHITVTGGGQVVDAERAENFLALIIESANLGAEFADDGGIIAIVNRILIPVRGVLLVMDHSRSEVGGPVAPAIAGPSLARLLYRGGDWRYAAYNKQFV